MMYRFYFVLCALFCSCWYCSALWGSKEDKVLLTDVSVLTLYSEKMTNGRRSSPVPQLECHSDGNAPCSAFKPRVAQCYNRGSDGVDVQWECKTDMDNTFRFGNIEVSCEGYDYPDDPYVLKGSCGLKYTLDYTKEGHFGKHEYYGDSSNTNYGWSYQSPHSKENISYSSKFADIIVYCAIGLMIWAFYKTCIGSNRNVDQDAHSPTNNDYPSGSGGGGYGWFGGTGYPNTHSTGHRSGYYDDASCRNRSTGTGGTGGFWTGAATGGLLGYMFGQRGGWGRSGYAANPGYSYGAHTNRSHSTYTPRSNSSSSSGTRTSSGFGGTSRR